MSESVVVEIKAGKLSLEGKQLVADKRKGVLQVLSDGASLKVVWRTRPENATELTFGSADVSVLEPLKGAPPRTLCLRSAPGGTRVGFFWIQEPDATRDAALISAFNDAIKPRVVAAAVSQPPPQPQTLAHANEPAIAPRQTAAPIRLDVLSAIMRQLSQPGSGDGDDGDVDLVDVLLPQDVEGVLSAEPGLCSTLYQFMPDDTRNMEGISDLIHSPQFRQSVEIFEVAVKSGEVGQILAEYGMDLSAQGSFGGMRRFLDALVARFGKKQQ